jgi:hypothetical protein
MLLLSTICPLGSTRIGGWLERRWDLVTRLAVAAVVYVG